MSIVRMSRYEIENSCIYMHKSMCVLVCLSTYVNMTVFMGLCVYKCICKHAHVHMSCVLCVCLSV